MSAHRLHEFVIAANHVHVMVSPLGNHTLSKILHSWKSFTAHQLITLMPSQRDPGSAGIWQKESFDHIVRSAVSMEKFRAYIRAHREFHARND